MRACLADLSRLLNRLTGGELGKTICWCVAMRWGSDCLFCKVIAAVMRERFHCRDELSARDFVEWLKKR